VLFPPVKVPLAPDDGAVNVTMTPAAGSPPEVTVATRGAKAVPIGMLCVIPLVAEIVPPAGGGVVPVFELEPPHPERKLTAALVKTRTNP
jgi:hypothetical protein